MARETREIRRDIASTREEIDEHLQELGGQVRTGLNVPQRAAAQARQNLPQLLAGAAIAGLFAGLVTGGGRPRSRLERTLTAEEARPARERQRLARERGRLKGTMRAAEFEEEDYDIPS